MSDQCFTPRQQNLEGVKMAGIPELKVKDREVMHLLLYNQGTHYLPLPFGSLLSTSKYVPLL